MAVLVFAILVTGIDKFMIHCVWWNITWSMLVWGFKNFLEVPKIALCDAINFFGKKLKVWNARISFSHFGDQYWQICNSFCVAEYYLEYVGMGFKKFLGVPKIALGDAIFFGKN